MVLAAWAESCHNVCCGWLDVAAQVVHTIRQHHVSSVGRSVERV
jgi:hypothetical protein